MAVDIGGFASNITSGLSPSGPLGQIFTFVLIGVAIGAVGYAVFVMMSYNVKVTIFRKTRFGTYAQTTKGKFYKNKDNGQEWFKLRGKTYSTFNQPLDKNYLVMSVAGKTVSKQVFLAEDKEGRLQPMKPVEESDLATWVGWRNSDMEFAVGHARRMVALVKTGDFWSKYGGLMQMGFMALMVVMLIVLFRQLDGVVGGLQSVASTLGEFKVISAGNATQVFA